MPDSRNLLERADRAVAHVPLPGDGIDTLRRRRDRRRRNNRLASGALGIVVSFLAIVIVVRAFSGGEPTPGEQSPSSTPAQSPTPTPSPTNVVVGDELGHHLLLDLRSGRSDPLPKSITSLSATDLSTSPDGTMIAFVSAGNLHIATVDGAAVQRLTETGDAQDPNWSPDGARIAYTTGDSVFVVHVESGRTSQLTDDLGTVWEPVFSPDGSQIVFTRSLNKADWAWLALWSVPLEGGPVRELIEDAAFGAFSPDGTQIAYLCIALPGDGHVWVNNFVHFADSDGTNHSGGGCENGSGGERGYESPEWSSLRPEWSPDGSRVVESEGGVWDWKGPGREGGTPGPIRIVSIGDGSGTYSETVAEAVHASWIDDDTLLLEDDQPR